MKKLTGIIAMFLLSGVLMAQVGDGTQQRRRRAPRINEVKELLALTEQQMTDLAAVQREMRGAAQPITQELRDLAMQLRDVVKSDPVDEAAAADLRAAIKAKREEIGALRSESRLAAHSILTAEQMETLAKLEEALALQRAAEQAVMLNLIEGPERGRGFGMGMTGRGRRGQPASGPKPPRRP
jgi:Spy/CpxP family protein refolding chaperone